MFRIQTLFMYTAQISSCVIDVCVYTASALQSVQLLELLCQSGRHQTFTVSAPLLAPPPSLKCLVAVRNGEDEGRGEMQMANGARVERKTWLVTQLDEGANM